MNTVIAGTACVAILMLALWLIQLKTGNASIVDMGWAGGLALQPHEGGAIVFKGEGEAGHWLRP